MTGYYDSPLGKILIELSERGINTLIFIDIIDNEADLDEMTSRQKFLKNHPSYLKDNECVMNDDLERWSERSSEMTSRCTQQLDEYFTGKRKSFDLPLDLRGTSFQIKVWEELLKIPFGTTISYKELSSRLGDLKAIRAVGTANGANPVSIIVPCHRVIGSDGSLTGYAGGLWRKEWLLDFESGIRSLF